MKIDLTTVDNVEIDYDTKDYPDFADAYITSADINGIEATDAELDALNKDSEFVHECLMEQLF